MLWRGFGTCPKLLQLQRFSHRFIHAIMYADFEFSERNSTAAETINHGY